MLDKKYYLKLEFNNLDLSDIRQALELEAKKYGFGVLTEIDVKKTMKEKIGKDYDKFLILGFCNPNFADKLLSYDKNFAVFLPCNVLLYEEQGKTSVSIVNPETMFPKELADKQEFVLLAREVKSIFESILEVLKQKFL